MTETPPAVVTYAGADDARAALGPVGNRLPTWVDLDTRLRIAHAEVTDRLVDVYGHTLPTFTGDALEVLRWAEAKLAASDVLLLLRAMLTDSDSAVATELRASALATLAGGVPGFRPPGPTDSGGSPTPGPDGTVSAGPRVSNAHTMSVFEDPYDPRFMPTRTLLGTADPLDPDVIIITT